MGLPHAGALGLLGRGVVFEADADDVARMDVWEDVPVYSLVPVTVETDDGPAEAHTYIMGQCAIDCMFILLYAYQGGCSAA